MKRKLIIGVNDLKTMHPELIKEWNYKKNYPLRPENVRADSNKTVWWMCSSGHEYTESIRRMAIGFRCPYDSGKLTKGITDLNVKFPEIAKEFDTEKNGYGPDEIAFNSKMEVWWKCPNGHSYKMSVLKRTKGKGCPICERSK
ncbi:MAG: zinc-ribbon domain-containing protein [Fusicatenibacter sp.]